MLPKIFALRGFFVDVISTTQRRKERERERKGKEGKREEGEKEGEKKREPCKPWHLSNFHYSVGLGGESPPHEPYKDPQFFIIRIGQRGPVGILMPIVFVCFFLYDIPYMSGFDSLHQRFFFVLFFSIEIPVISLVSHPLSTLNNQRKDYTSKALSASTNRATIPSIPSIPTIPTPTLSAIM